MSKETDELIQKLIFHELDGLKDPVFKEGYDAYANGIPSSSNPYEFDDGENWRHLSLLAVQKSPLTEEQRESMKVLREFMDGTEWSRWSRGYYCVNSINEIKKILSAG